MEYDDSFDLGKNRSHALLSRNRDNSISITLMRQGIFKSLDKLKINADALLQCNQGRWVKADGLPNYERVGDEGIEYCIELPIECIFMNLEGPR